MPVSAPDLSPEFKSGRESDATSGFFLKNPCFFLASNVGSFSLKIFWFILYLIVLSKSFFDSSFLFNKFIICSVLIPNETIQSFILVATSSIVLSSIIGKNFSIILSSLSNVNGCFGLSTNCLPTISIIILQFVNKLKNLSISSLTFSIFLFSSVDLNNLTSIFFSFIHLIIIPGIFSLSTPVVFAIVILFSIKSYKLAFFNLACIGSSLLIYFSNDFSSWDFAPSSFCFSSSATRFTSASSATRFTSASSATRFASASSAICLAFSTSATRFASAAFRYSSIISVMRSGRDFLPLSVIFDVPKSTICKHSTILSFIVASSSPKLKLSNLVIISFTNGIVS